MHPVAVQNSEQMFVIIVCARIYTQFTIESIFYAPFFNEHIVPTPSNGCWIIEARCWRDGYWQVICGGRNWKSGKRAFSVNDLRKIMIRWQDICLGEQDFNPGTDDCNFGSQGTTRIVQFEWNHLINYIFTQEPQQNIFQFSSKKIFLCIVGVIQ